MTVRVPARRSHDLWVITTYFNPAGFERRRANFRVFRERLNAPLVAVEIAFGSAFDLHEGDADILIQLKEGDVLWQKERLLNVALRSVPKQASKVAWLDCDVVFEADDWAERVSAALNRISVLQPFGLVFNMPQSQAVHAPHLGAARTVQASLASAVVKGGDPVRCFEAGRSESGPAQYRPGLAWAARRDFIERFGFYDACIIGGGDRAMACAYFGCMQHVIERQRMNRPQQQRYLEWARPVFETVRGAVGCVDLNLIHLWHGEGRDRKLWQRHADISEFHFDPDKDIAVAESGGWRWNSDKPGFHAYLRDYFASRKEDG